MAEKSEQTIYLVKPPKSLKEMTREERREWASGLHQKLVSLRAAEIEAEAAREPGEVREESGYSKWYRSVRDARIAQAEREAQALEVDSPEPQTEEK